MFIALFLSYCFNTIQKLNTVRKIVQYFSEQCLVNSFFIFEIKVAM